MKKILFVITIFIACFLLIPHEKEVKSLGNNFNIYLEDNGEYTKSNSSNFPNSGYYLNNAKSECENESILSQNNDLSINMSFNKADKCNLYFDKLKVVTFDANGGEVGVQSMLVRPGGTYENLPTPTREGYTFLGWNGKNMFDEEKWLMPIEGATHENEYFVFNPSKAHTLYGAFLNDSYEYSYVGSSNIEIDFKDNTSYTISFKGFTDYIDTYNVHQSIFICFLYTDKTETYDVLNTGVEKEKYVVSDPNKKIEHIVISFGREIGNVHLSYMQIEEGDSATEYEPYYITNGTKVVQDKDHTLKAIWKKNE